MSETDDMMPLVVEALEYYGGRATLMDISRYLWGKYENKFRASDDLFYRWQYVLRWAGTQLRKQGTMVPAENSPQGVWILAK